MSEIGLASIATGGASPWVYVAVGVAIIVAAFFVSYKRIDIAIGNSALIVAGAIIASLGVIQNFKLTASGIEVTTTTKIFVEQITTLNDSIAKQVKVNDDLKEQIKTVETRLAVLAASAASSPAQGGGTSNNSVSKSLQIDEFLSKSAPPAAGIGAANKIIIDNAARNAIELQMFRDKLGIK
ncbi:hypothetical protein ACFSCV_15910 [Methylopila henanensis]|uniref:Uncharacterized protein n=1 Tax=Methylopila henanensis TaxID=873516 RepID=A0ABW4K9X7_9HYPH